MAKSSTHVDLQGSVRTPYRNAKRTTPIESDTRIEVTVRLRRDPIPASTLSPARGKAHLTHAEFEANHGVKDADLSAVAQFAQKYGLAVVASKKAEGSVVLSGTAAQFQSAFDVELYHQEYDGGTYRGREGAVRIPTELAGVVSAVFGLDNRPFARPHFTRGIARRAAEAATFNPQALAKIYNFPEGVTGTGQTIGIIELGGGYRPADLRTYFKNVGAHVTGKTTAVSVDHGKNRPGGNADVEVMLDIEVAAAIAPGANIAVYFGADATDRSFLDAVAAAVHDQHHAPSVISISWGGPEGDATDAFSTQMDATLQAAAALGITVCVASGDNGAADEGPNEWDGKPHADSPASSPHALGVGGTRLLASNGTRTDEQVWNQHAADTQDDSFGASGGGFSVVFETPSWQTAVLPAGRSGRGVPDVAADADPATGYNIRADGQDMPVGGTSAAAPLWAALIALINQKLGRRVGFINPKLYQAKGSPAFNSVTAGNNKVGSAGVGFDAGSPWNACAGLGTPNGQEILKLL
jgi:kumamolisin